MGCTLPCRQTDDGTKVVIVVPDDVANKPRSYFLASDMTTPWTGDPDTLGPCIVCEPQQIVSQIAATVIDVCEVDTVTLDIVAEYVGNLEEGYEVTASGSVPTQLLAGTLTANIPDSPPGTVLLMQVTSGSDQDFNTGESYFGQVAVSNTSNTTIASNPVELHVEQTNFSYYDQIYGFDNLQAGGGATVTFSVPDVQAGVDEGVINIKFIRLSAANGPVTLANLDTGSIVNWVYQGAVTEDTFILSPEFASPTNCPAIVLGHGRHVQQNNDQRYDFMVDADWTEFSAGTELYDTSSQGQTPQQNPCQIGQSAAFIPPNTTFTVGMKTNLTSGNAAADRFGAVMIPTICETTLCDPADPTALSTVEYTAENCEKTVSKMISVDNIRFTVDANSAVRLVPVVDGADVTAEAITVTNTTGSQIVEEHDLSITLTKPNLASGGSGSCTVQFRPEVVSGEPEDATIEIPAVDVIIDLAVA